MAATFCAWAALGCLILAGVKELAGGDWHFDAFLAIFSMLLAIWARQK
jgi:hypothetical protein